MEPGLGFGGGDGGVYVFYKLPAISWCCHLILLMTRAQETEFATEF